MRRSTTATTVAVLVSLLFLLGGVTEAYGLHGCSLHHDPASAAHADHSVAGPTAQPDPEEAGPRFCTCLGSCHGGAATPVPQLDVVSLVADSGASIEIPGARVWFDPRGLSAYLLPFPNGPPRG